MRAARVTSQALARSYSRSARACAVIPFNLTDIGEGIQEVEIIEWFIEAGAEIKQFDRVCEVQSDKVRWRRCAAARAAVGTLPRECSRMPFILCASPFLLSPTPAAPCSLPLCRLRRSPTRHYLPSVG